MLSGDKALAADVPPSADGGGTRALALLLVLLCGAGVAVLVGVVGG
jgi:hypothetical protein